MEGKKNPTSAAPRKARGGPKAVASSDAVAAKKAAAVPKASADKPDPTKYNEVVSAATIRDIRLVGAKLDFKPEAIDATSQEWNFDVTDQLDSWGCDNQRAQLSGVHSFIASLMVGKRKVLSVECRYLTNFRLTGVCDEDAGRHYVSRVGRMAAYPYFRATFATLTQQSGIALPPLPVLNDGPRWVNAPKPEASPSARRRKLV